MDTAPAPPIDDLPTRQTIAIWDVELEVVGQIWFPRWTGPALNLRHAVQAATLAFYGTAFFADAETRALYPLRLKSASRFDDRRDGPAP